MSDFPTGIEQARRDFMREHPTLYDYVEARIMARAYDLAGDIASGAVDGRGAANRIWDQEQRYKQRASELREKHPAPTRVELP